jgi:acetyl-CoA carboxylase carboxyl transferase subunit beta
MLSAENYLNLSSFLWRFLISSYSFGEQISETIKERLEYQNKNAVGKTDSGKRPNIPNGLWNRCEVCGEVTFSKELARNFKICPKCGYHYTMSVVERIQTLTVPKNFIEYKSNIKIPNTGFETLPSELVIAGETKLQRYQIVLCIINSSHINDSSTQFRLSKTEYQKILYTFNKSLMKSLPLITFYADGTIINLKSEYAATVGDSENIENINFTDAKSLVSEFLSFTFLTNLAATVENLSQKRIPHITVLTNPRIGSEFSTSFPLGDIVLAEPKPVPRKSNDKKNSAVAKNVPSLHPSFENYIIDEYVDRRNVKKDLQKILSFCIG